MRTFDKDSWILRAVAHGAYRVERSGVVYRDVGGQWRRQKMSTHARSGRVYFNLRYEGTTKSVLLNRVVALVHIPNPHELPEVNHKFGRLEDNGAEDLEWAGRGEQEKHAFAHGLKANRGSANANAKLTAEKVLAIRAASGGHREIAREHACSVRTVRDVRARRTWNHV